jgi:predicted DNA-binding transcriptional regulator AlpA
MGPSVLGRRKAMMTDRKTISIMKACELVGVSRRTIYNWIASGKV